MLNSELEISPLNLGTLSEALRLAKVVFPAQGVLHNTNFAFRLSLRQGHWFTNICYRIAGIRSTQYWVVSEINSKRIVAITGIYENIDDESEALWGGWTCVHPTYRGKGLGRHLFNFVIEKARDQKKQYVRAYTSTAENEKAAQPLYESLGLKIVESKKILFSKHRMLFRELKL